MCRLLLKDPYCDSLSAMKAVSVFRRKRKRFAAYEEQNKADCGMCDPL